MKSTIFWDITPNSPLKFNRRFGGTYRLHLQDRKKTTYFHPGGVDKTKNNSGANIFFLQIPANKTMNLNLKIQAPGKNFQAPWRPGALYLSTPVTLVSCSAYFSTL
jgi:hypothetical protein